MSYVDGYVLPLSKDKIDDYRKTASHAGAIWKEYGALSYKEFIAEDLEGHGMRTFSVAADAQENETVVFCYVLYRDRQHRDEVNAKVMADPRLTEQCGENVFDFKRMAYGGFTSIVDL